MDIPLPFQAIAMMKYDALAINSSKVLGWDWQAWLPLHLLASLDFWEVHITQDHGPERYLNYFPLQWPFSFFGNKHRFS